MTSELIAMRREGLANAEIAARLGVSLSALGTQVGKLIREGALGARRGLLWPHPDSWAEDVKRTPHDVAPAVERLHRDDKSHQEIAGELNLTGAQVHNIRTGLFAAGLPKRPRRSLSDEQARAIPPVRTAAGSGHRGCAGCVRVLDAASAAFNARDRPPGPAHQPTTHPDAPTEAGNARARAWAIRRPRAA
jgi:hypothetical protein